MNNTTFFFERPKNEVVLGYAPNSPEREALQKEVERQYNTCIEIPLIIGGKEVKTGEMGKVVMPTEHGHVLATYHKATPETVQMAIDAAMQAREKWANLHWIERSSIMLKAAELLSKKYR